jgi:hypothetical protein
MPALKAALWIFHLGISFFFFFGFYSGLLLIIGGG